MLSAKSNRVGGPRSARAAARRSLLRSLALLLVLGLAAVARADATVIVEVKRADGSPADGIVLLTQGDAKWSCTTSKGRCEIRNVKGGTYVVKVERPGGDPSKPKSVMIPPAGEVKLIVAVN